jgi:hypothetical protein
MLRRLGSSKEALAGDADAFNYKATMSSHNMERLHLGA